MVKNLTCQLCSLKRFLHKFTTTTSRLHIQLEIASTFRQRQMAWRRPTLSTCVSCVIKTVCPTRELGYTQTKQFTGLIEIVVANSKNFGPGIKLGPFKMICKHKLLYIDYDLLMKCVHLMSPGIVLNVLGRIVLHIFYPMTSLYC